MIAEGKIALGKPDAHGPFQVIRTWCAYVTVEVVPGILRRTYSVPWSQLDLQRDQLQIAILQGHLLAGRACVNEFTVTLVKNTKAHGRVVDKVRHFYRHRDGKWRSV